MTSEPPTGTPPGAGLLSELTTVLAGILGVKAEAIDAEQPFQLLGLDSMLTVEFVATVNARYGTRVRAGAVYDHPTPAGFVRHLAAELGVLGPAPAAAPALVHGAAAGSASAVGSVPASVVDVLRAQLAAILACEPWDIDADSAFNLLGLDSVLGAEFVAGINRTYGLDERAVCLYDHPSLNAMAAHITSLTAGTVAPGPVSGAAGQGAGPLDLEALLDAVRDDRLSVDEATVFLAAHAA
ncbi:acyl carrier protein [Streptomyces sp. NPDC053750]|uniref:acyl carrier protein n=1 Tax=Streptomyces sp. NPDC053750 TaxID=3365714 RepID=UPI0037D8B2D0